MNTWKSVVVWLGITLLVVITIIIVVPIAKINSSPPDPQTQLVRKLAGKNDPSLPDVLDRSVVYVPAGSFIRGSDTGNFNEYPEQLIYLDAFEIDRYEVTNIQYSRYLEATGNRPPSYWENGSYPTGQLDYPVVGISWKDADAYCTWVGKRLPTEAEWEKACRGPNGNLYPWGTQWDQERANVDHLMISLTQSKRDGSPTAFAYAWELLPNTPGSGGLGLRPVGSYPEGASFYGVMDMIGNVSEWVFDWYNWGDYSKLSIRNPINLEPPWNHCIRGSAWHDPTGDLDQVQTWSRCSTRSSAHSISDVRTGFRCVQSVVGE